jgi:prepilin peptidase CpaA
MDPILSIHDAWLFSLTCVAALTDARNGTIPNWLTLPTLALAPLAHALQSGPGALAWSLASAAVCGLVPLLLFRAGAMGGGDVKLFAAAGALAGMHAGLALQLLSYVLAASGAACRLAYRGELGPVLRRTWALLTRSARLCVASDAQAREAGPSVRLGVAVFAACLVLAAQRALELMP